MSNLAPAFFFLEDGLEQAILIMLEHFQREEEPQLDQLTPEDYILWEFDRYLETATNASYKHATKALAAITLAIDVLKKELESTLNACIATKEVVVLKAERLPKRLQARGFFDCLVTLRDMTELEKAA